MNTTTFIGSQSHEALQSPTKIPTLLQQIADRNPNQTALMYRVNDAADWNEISYKEYRDQVIKLAKTFIKLGLTKRGTVAILADNSVEWFVSELATIHAG
jgi:long-subunit acyl-CoA synthetase (AMP-forming)